eukprot:TRINITY_DN13108_c0_g1_i1.p1 TRINITY_DN13108_c0_g1~~TRINITY_DN13108_c0_g1_i1.p1  ORF type:complete len:223 (+),score=11.53 TRINITY_DN13108_c0_g1_i1:160-828(+)
MAASYPAPSYPAAGAPGSVASFSHDQASTNDWDVRSDETIQLEFVLYDQETADCGHRGGLLCGIIFCPCTLGFSFCYACSVYQAGTNALGSRLFVTERAIYQHTEGSVAGIRLPYERMKQVHNGEPSCGCFYNVCLCGDRPDDASQIMVTSDDEHQRVVTTGTGDHRRTQSVTVDRFKIQFPLIKDAPGVARLFLFLRDAVKNQQVIDWQSVQREFDHTIKR